MDLTTAGPDEIQRRSLREQVYDSVLRMLLDGRIASGDRLSIDSVARMLHVSPTPVREAFVMLERTGLVTRVALRGYRVAPPLDEQQLTELFDARLVLEVEAAAKAHAHRGELVPVLRARAQEHSRRAEDIVSHGAEGSIPVSVTQAYFQSDADFHHAIFRYAGNRYLTEMYDSLGALTHRMRQTVHRGPEDVKDAVREHGAVLAAFESGSGRAAAKAMRTHINGVRARSLLAHGS